MPIKFLLCIGYSIERENHIIIPWFSRLYIKNVKSSSPIKIAQSYEQPYILADTIAIAHMMILRNRELSC